MLGHRRCLMDIRPHTTYAQKPLSPSPQPMQPIKPLQPPMAAAPQLLPAARYRVALLIGGVRGVALEGLFRPAQLLVDLTAEERAGAFEDPPDVKGGRGRTA